MKVYISTNYRTSDPVRKSLELMPSNLGIELFQADYFNIEEQVIPQIIETIKKADVVIADISNENPNIYYEIGIAHALGKPVILVSQTNNFNRFSLISYRFYNYNISEEGIKNLSFVLEQILSSKDELNKLKPLLIKNDVLNFEEFSSENKLNNILNLAGPAKYYELEKWIYNLLTGIPGFDVHSNERKRDQEYDFIIWNTNESEDLQGLGNPIPVEVKAVKDIDNALFRILSNKASSQGFKSFILITTANLTEGNKKSIRNLKAHSNISILVIDRVELNEVHSSKDLLKVILKTFRKFFIY